jgi:hypothetical protein
MLPRNSKTLQSFYICDINVLLNFCVVLICVIQLIQVQQKSSGSPVPTELKFPFQIISNICLYPSGCKMMFSKFDKTDSEAYFFLKKSDSLSFTCVYLPLRVPLVLDD